MKRYSNSNYYFIFSLLCCLPIACTKDENKQVAFSIEEQAKVIGVECTGQPNNYTLSVTIQSPDTGCEQYADWWEVFYPDSTLIYRRILAHSHVMEQPFTRSGGIVEVGADEFIYVRAHMNNTGYGSQVFSGNVRDGLVQDSLRVDYALSLASTAPLAEDCDF